MDGDGSIQVNHWRKKNLQFRLIIKLKYTINNYNMLLLMKQNVGGNVQIVANSSFVIWVENIKEKIINHYFSIFLKYPPLTTRLQCQLAFLSSCINLKDISQYFKLRENKYINHKIYETIVKQNIISRPKEYFCIWLSGFIEAEGCFSIRISQRNKSFSIGQNTDLFLLELIKNYFSVPNKIRLIYNAKTDKNFYLLEIGSNLNLQKVYNHCITYPLLGHKATQFKKFYSEVNFQ